MSETPARLQEGTVPTQPTPECDCGMPHLGGTEHADECPAGVHDPTHQLQELKRCAQCGREGTRDFKVLSAEPGDGPYTPPPPITVCASAKACRSRWPRRLSDDE